MTRRNLVTPILLAAVLAAIPVAPGPAAQTPPAPPTAPATGVSEPTRGPDSKDLFESIHVVVGPSSRALDPIAVSPFACVDGAQGSCKEIDDVLTKDLTLSGFFKVLDPAAFLGDPATADASAPHWDNWFNVGAKYLVTVGVSKGASGLDLRFRLFSVGDRKSITVKGSTATNVAPKGIRRAVHAFVNGIIEAITGKPGIFGSQVLMSLKMPGFERVLQAMDMDGSGRRTIIENKSANMFPRWAPGGGVLYTSFLSGLPQIYVDDRRITHDDRQYRSAAFAPDGSRIVASVDMDGQSDLVILDPKTGAITKRLTESEWDEVTPSWSPDGRSIAYCSNKTGRPQIYLMNGDGTGERRLTMRGSYNTSPRFGPTGLVAFAGMDDFVSDLFTVDMSGNINRLTQQQGSNKDPAWSPDGRWLVFMSDRAGAWRVFLMTEDGRYQFPVTGKGEPVGTPDWR